MKKNKKIRFLLSYNDDKLSKKLKLCGIKPKEADELEFHLTEIERSFLEILNSIKNILRIRNKEKILEELENIWSEFEVHIVENHIIPAKKIIEKIII